MRKTFMLAAGAALMLFSSMRASAQNPKGALIVNEISNGTNGTKEFAEFIVGSSDSSATPNTQVDISRWIVDDNNGVFSNGNGSGKGISAGHIRLADIDFWRDIKAGTLVVLFNGKNYDTTLDATNWGGHMAAAVSDPNGFTTTSSAIYVAVGLSPLIESVYFTPSFNDSEYCSTVSGQDSLWDYVGLRNDCAGDGIQVRCPSCTSTSGEPLFYHGVSYGTDMVHVPSQGYLEGAHIDLLDITEDSTCAAGKTFFMFNNAANVAGAGVDDNWTFDVAGSATPGAANTPDNQLFINSIAGINNFEVARCQDTQIPTPPTDTTSQRGKGVIVVSEMSNGTSGNCEFAELVVANCGSDNSNFVDVSGWIIDDNSGNFSVNGCVSSTGISNGHYRLPFNDIWGHVKVGSIILLYNVTENCYSLPTTYTYDSTAGVYYLPIGADNKATTPATPHLEMFTSTPAVGACQYCPANTANTYAPAKNWSAVASFNNSDDAIQVRCPGCNTMFTGAPNFYHGFGYGPATGTSQYAAIPATANSVGGAVQNTSGGTSSFIFNGTTAAQLADGTFWTKVAATAATPGAIPAAFRSVVEGHTLAVPCCGTTTVTTRQANTSGLNNTATEAKGIFAYPNPANSVLNVEFPATDKEVSVKIIDLNGRVIAAQSGTGKTKVQFDVNNVTAGFYIYQVITNGSVQSGKILINK